LVDYATGKIRDEEIAVASKGQASRRTDSGGEIGSGSILSELSDVAVTRLCHQQIARSIKGNSHRRAEILREGESRSPRCGQSDNIPVAGIRHKGQTIAIKNEAFRIGQPNSKGARVLPVLTNLRTVLGSSHRFRPGARADGNQSTATTVAAAINNRWR
jgi:hypothetical protein